MTQTLVVHFNRRVVLMLVLAAVIKWTMDCGVLDTAREARLESMRRQSRSAQVLRRHEDLRKQCEREVLLYERAQRLMTAQCRRSQVRCQQHLYSHLFLTSDRPGKCSAMMGTGGQAAVSVRLLPSSEGEQKARLSKQRLLFRVLHRNGKDIYIRNHTQPYTSRQLVGNVTRDLDKN